MMNLEASLSAITNSIRETLQSPNDLTVREFALSGSSTRCAVVFLCGITDKDLIYRFVIHPLQHEEIPPKGPIMQTLVDRFISIGEINTVKTFPDLVNSVLVGDTVVLIDGIPHALVINCRAWEKRGLEPPITEDVIRGPKVGFVEDIATNKMLIRRELRDPKLRFQSYIMGQRSQKRSYINLY